MSNSQGSSVNAQAILQVAGRGLPLRGHDIDTDRIMPARFLVAVSFAGLEQHLFEDDRKANPAHPFNDPRYRAASILVVNTNFGCGSSREHAPQGLVRAGYRAVIGESFSEIFQGNAAMLGMPCFAAGHDDIARLQALIEQTPDVAIAADVATGAVTADALRLTATLPAALRDGFLSGQWNPTAIAARPVRRSARRRGPAAVRVGILTFRDWIIGSLGNWVIDYPITRPSNCSIRPTAMKRVALATVILSAIALTARAQPARDNPSTSAAPLRSISGPRGR